MNRVHMAIVVSTGATNEPPLSDLSNIGMCPFHALSLSFPDFSQRICCGLHLTFTSYML